MFESAVGSLSSSFPMQVNIGGFYDISNALRTVVEYSFTEYGKNRSISTTGKLLFPDGSEAVDMSEHPIELGWSHQQQGKLGFIYSGFSNWTLRTGYSLVGQVTPKSKASPTFAPPGLAHVVALGVGARLGSMMADVAYEYTRATGQGVAPTEGEFVAEAHALHAGVSLGF
jgi:long-subunit fatty acid transport protein